MHVRIDRTCELRRHLFNAICNPFSRTNVHIFYDDDYYSLKIYLYMQPASIHWNETDADFSSSTER